MSNSVNSIDVQLVLLATGTIVSGVWALAAIAYRPQRSAARQPLVEPFENFGAAVRASHVAASDLLPLIAQRLVLVQPRQSWLGTPRTDQITRELAKSLEVNAAATSEIARTIAEEGGRNLDQPSERRRIRRKIKTIARRLTTSFWDKRGKMILAREPLLGQMLKSFYWMVENHKKKIKTLSSFWTPTISELKKVFDDSIVLLDGISKIIDYLKARN